MTARNLSRREAAKLLEELRRDISAARLRVTVDGKLGHDTPLSVKKLASLPDPPSIEGTDESQGTDPQADPIASFRSGWEAMAQTAAQASRGISDIDFPEISGILLLPEAPWRALPLLTGLEQRTTKP